MRKSLFKGLIIFGTLAFLSINQSPLFAMELVDDLASEVEKIPSASMILSSSVLSQRSEVPKSFHYMNVELEAVDFPTKQGHTPTPIAKLNKQPNRDGLKNKAGPDLKVWVEHRDQKWEVYRKDWRRWNKRKVAQEQNANLSKKPKTEEAQNSAKSEAASEQKEEIVLTLAAGAVEKRRREFTGPQGYYRSWTWHEFEELIFSPVVDIYSLERPYNTPPRKKGSYINPEDLVVGFVLSPSDLKIAHTMLKRLIADLKREQFALNKVIIFYESTFKYSVNGWSSDQLTNWWYMDGPIKEVQVEIDEAVRRQFDEDYMRKSLPLSRDLTTDRGRLLAKLNRDVFGVNFRQLFFKIKERSLIDLTTIKDEWIEEGYALLPKYSEPEEKKEEVKVEKKEEDEQGEKKEGDKQEEKKRTFKNRYNGLDETKERICLDKEGKQVVIKTVVKRAFPEGLPTNFSKRFETFKVPSKAGTVKWENSNKLQMIDEVIPFESMARHRAFYHKVLFQLYEGFGSMKGPQWKFIKPEPEPDYEDEKDTIKRKALIEKRMNIIRTPPYNSLAVSQWQYDSQILKEYFENQCNLRAFLLMQRNLHLKLHICPTYFWIKSYIPEPWRLFLREPVLKVEASPSTPGEEIDLSDAGIKDEDIECKISLVYGTNQGTFQRLLGPYRVVNLSGNGALSGTIDYGLNLQLKKLVVRSCNISSLIFVRGLQLLEFLDFSENFLTLGDEDVDILSKLKNLSYLNVSDNDLTRVDPFTPLTKLTELNVSKNKITSLHPLVANLKLKILVASHNPLSGLWSQALPSKLAKLEHLDLSNYGKEFEQEFTGSKFKDRFPSLLWLKVEGEAIGFSPQQDVILEEHSDSGFETDYSEGLDSQNIQQENDQNQDVI